MAPALLQGPNGDLWCLVLRVVGMSWIRAHTSLDSALAGGFAALDHAGNAAADHAALAHARRLQPPLNHRLARGKLYKAVRLAQVMIAEVQIAAIAANRKRLTKIKFKRRNRRRVRLRRRIKVPRLRQPRANPPLVRGHLAPCTCSPLPMGPRRSPLPPHGALLFLGQCTVRGARAVCQGRDGGRLLVGHSALRPQVTFRIHGPRARICLPGSLAVGPVHVVA